MCAEKAGVMVIDLSKYITPALPSLVGRENGRAMLKKLEAGERTTLEAAEKAFDVISVSIPEQILTMNKSFFLGAFSARVIALGKDGFLSKYSFLASEHLKTKILSHVDFALKTATAGEILDVD